MLVYKIQPRAPNYKEMGMSNNKELIWVSKEFAAQYNELETLEAQERIAKEVLEKKRLDLSSEYELLDESLLQFKAVCLSHKNALEKVYIEEADKIYKMWEEMGDVRSKVSEHARALADEIKPLKNEIEYAQNAITDLKNQLDGLDVYGAERVAGLAETVAGLNEGAQGILKFMVDNYKQPQRR